MARPTLLESIADPATGRAIPNASVTLRQPGTTTPIAGDIYAGASGGSPISQPLSADANGLVQAYPADPQTVDVHITAPGRDPIDLYDYPIYPRPEDVITLDGTATLTNKTLSSPTINNPTVTGGSFASPALTGTPTIATPTITGATLAGKTTLPTNGASRVFEGLQSALGNAGWGSAGTAFSNPTHTALVDGATSAALAEGRPFAVIERHVKPQTLSAEQTNPLNTLRVTTRVYDQGTPDVGYVATPETASITGVGVSSSQQRVGSFGTAIEGVVGYALSLSGSHASPYSLYGINYLYSKNANGFGLEMDSHNATGQEAYVNRQRPPGYRPNSTDYEGSTYGANLLAVADGGGSDYCTMALLIQGGAGTSRWQQGIGFGPLAIKSGGEAIDCSLLPTDVSPIMLQSGGVITAAKAENNSGTVTTGSTSTTLKAGGSPGWATNVFAGQWVRISGGGAALGQVRKIASNTTDTLTLDTSAPSSAWATTPSSGDSFIISPNRINVLGVHTDNATRFYSDMYWDWRSNDASTLKARLRADTGMFGVGTHDPLARLHITGAGQSSTPTTATGDQGASVFVVDTDAGVGGGGMIGLGATGGSGRGIQWVQKAVAAVLTNYGYGDLVFYGRLAGNEGNDTLTEHLRLAVGGALRPRGAVYPLAQSANGYEAWTAASTGSLALYPSAGGFGGTTMHGTLHVHNETDGASFDISVNGSSGTVTMVNGVATPSGLTLSDSGSNIAVFWSGGALYVRNRFGVSKTISAHFLGTI